MSISTLVFGDEAGGLQGIIELAVISVEKRSW